MAEATSRTRLALGEALVLQLRGLMTEARNHGGGAVEDPLAAWRGACPGASPPRGGAIGSTVAARKAAAGAIWMFVRFFSPIAAAAARAAARFYSHSSKRLRVVAAALRQPRAAREMILSSRTNPRTHVLHRQALALPY